MDNNFDFGCHGNEIGNGAKFLCQVLTACKISNKSNGRLLRYCTFIFSLSCSIASVTSCLSENEAKNLQNGDVHLAQIWNISRTIWRIKGGDGSFFVHVLSVELYNLFFTLFHFSFITFFSTGGSL